jgi:hypothetical protein
VPAVDIGKPCEKIRRQQVREPWSGFVEGTGALDFVSPFQFKMVGVDDAASWHARVSHDVDQVHSVVTVELHIGDQQVEWGLEHPRGPQSGAPRLEIGDWLHACQGTDATIHHRPKGQIGFDQQHTFQSFGRHALLAGFHVLHRLADLAIQDEDVYPITEPLLEQAPRVKTCGQDWLEREDQSLETMLERCRPHVHRPGTVAARFRG